MDGTKPLCSITANRRSDQIELIDSVSICTEAQQPTQALYSVQMQTYKHGPALWKHQACSKQCFPSLASPGYCCCCCRRCCTKCRLLLILILTSCLFLADWQLADDAAATAIDGDDGRVSKYGLAASLPCYHSDSNQRFIN